uniref:Uncharacterized protein n=1 Tax=Chelonoidis abingdonii TaxID=106734 RepID=A0A8C0HBH1_CHEAB
MALNLSRNGPALQEPMAGWALFTYEGNSNDLRVAGTGGECIWGRLPPIWDSCAHLGSGWVLGC